MKCGRQLVQVTRRIRNQQASSGAHLARSAPQLATSKSRPLAPHSPLPLAQSTSSTLTPSQCQVSPASVLPPPPACVPGACARASFDRRSPSAVVLALWGINSYPTYIRLRLPLLPHEPWMEPAAQAKGARTPLRPLFCAHINGVVAVPRGNSIASHSGSYEQK